MHLGRTWANNISAAGYASRSSSTITTGTRWVIRLNELCSVVRHSRRTTQDS